MRFWNANLLGIQYGGSIYSFVDPFYMIMWLKNVGKGFSVWDKAATIWFLKPGRTDLTAEFLLSEEDVTEVKKALQELGRIDWVRKVALRNSQGEVVAQAHFDPEDVLAHPKAAGFCQQCPSWAKSSCASTGPQEPAV